MHSYTPTAAAGTAAKRIGNCCVSTVACLQSRCGECNGDAQAESLWPRLKTKVQAQREQHVFADLLTFSRGVLCSLARA